MASVAPLIQQLALQYGLDPAAVIAVARGEGGLVNRPDDVGDLAGGGSYGPFQLYTKGALPARYRGNPQAADSWAWSPEGIKYALGRMAAVGAVGQRGPQAVNTIIRKFERPAAPDKSVAAALARLGSTTAPVSQGRGLIGTGSVNGGAASIPPPSTGQSTRRETILNALIRGDDPNDLIQSLPGLPPDTPPAVRTPPVAPQRGAMGQTPTPLTGGGIRELIYDPVGSIFDGVRSNKPYGGHSDHLHYAGSSPQAMLKAIALAQSLGLNVRENPYTDPVDPVHTKNSHHYQTFPGLYKGRKLGQAADISGNAQALRTLYARLAGL